MERGRLKSNGISIKNNEKIPQKEIAAASGVTEVTIRNRFKDLKKLLES
jgi:transcription initiation factor TFIIIB Brf1 subunit/transcription initiation factor TFIIB